MKKALLISVAVLAGFAASVTALQIDPVMEFGRARVFVSGIAQWIIAGNSNNQLEIKTAAGQNAATFDDGTGSVLLGAWTSAGLATLSAPASGYIAVNISNLCVCISSGPGQGAWVGVSTSAHAGSQQFYSCR